MLSHYRGTGLMMVLGVVLRERKAAFTHLNVAAFALQSDTHDGSREAHCASVHMVIVDGRVVRLGKRIAHNAHDLSDDALLRGKFVPQVSDMAQQVRFHALYPRTFHHELQSDRRRCSHRSTRARGKLLSTPTYRIARISLNEAPKAIQRVRCALKVSLGWLLVLHVPVRKGKVNATTNTLRETCGMRATTTQTNSIL